MMDLGLFISLQDSDACPVAHSLTKLLLGAIIISGVIVSYVPQIHKMVTSKSSEGLSIWFLLLGSIGCFSTIGNVTLLQYQSILCCRTKWSPGYCFEDTLGVTQVSTQLLGFCVVVAAFYIYYPIDSTIVLVDSGDFEPLESIRSSSEWQRTKGVGMFIIAYAVLVAASLVVVLHIQDPDLFLQARLWWAGVLGLISASSGVVQFVPQIIHTWQAKSGGALSMSMLAIQAPGSFIFAISLAAQPGTNWTSWISFVVGGSLQVLLLSMCITYHYKIPASNAQEYTVGSNTQPRGEYIEESNRPLIQSHNENIISVDENTAEESEVV
ncbi:hypothetical protein BASA62_006183 [Batrachochytrium salamandrivorans]|nr:hypothetical protein BASA62_006183 [Batrachochytrium salamandrivorans]